MTRDLSDDELTGLIREVFDEPPPLPAEPPPHVIEQAQAAYDAVIRTHTLRQAPTRRPR